MTRLLPLIAVLSFGLTFLLFPNPEVGHAQTARTDTIYFMAATRGNDYNGDSLRERCWVRQADGSVWHGRFNNGLDEVPQTGSDQPPPVDPSVYCPSNWTEKVDLATFGSTDNTNCT